MTPRSTWSLELRLRRRLLAVILAVGGFTAAIVGVHYGSDVADLHQRQVLEMAEALAADFEDMPAGEGGFDPDATEKDWIYNGYRQAYGWIVYDPQGVEISQSDFDWSAVDELAADGIDEWTQRTDDGTWLAGKEFDCGLPAECRVVTVVASDPAHRFYRLILGEIFVHVLMPVIPFAILSIWAVGGVVRQTLKPLREISEQAQGVSEFRHIRPLIVENPPDEVVDLVKALNGSLERLAAAMERERAFILDASHTLRTPLAALKARLQQDGGQADLAKLKQDTDALIRLSTQLLAHANADRLNVLPVDPINISELIMDVVFRMEPLAQQAGIDLGCEGCEEAVSVIADPDAISIALINLIENAIEHSPSGTSVTVQLLAAPMRIAVVDEGVGVAEDKLSKITTRFTRAGQGRGHGAGLGLSIVEQIMRAHGGRLLLSRNDDAGLTVTLEFAQT